jgi:hypothetical protein
MHAIRVPIRIGDDRHEKRADDNEAGRDLAIHDVSFD